MCLAKNLFLWEMEGMDIGGAPTVSAVTCAF